MHLTKFHACCYYQNVLFSLLPAQLHFTNLHKRSFSIGIQARLCLKMTIFIRCKEAFYRISIEVCSEIRSIPVREAESRRYSMKRLVLSIRFCIRLCSTKSSTRPSYCGWVVFKDAAKRKTSGSNQHCCEHFAFYLLSLKSDVSWFSKRSYCGHIKRANIFFFPLSFSLRFSSQSQTYLTRRLPMLKHDLTFKMSHGRGDDN